MTAPAVPTDVTVAVVPWGSTWPSLDVFRGLARDRRVIPVVRRLLADGRVRVIGTSNFKPAHLDRLYAETGALPDVNQIQLSPTVARAQVRGYHRGHGIVTQSWSPLGQGSGLLDEPAVRGIAEAHGMTPAQVVLRWHVQQGLVAIPKSSHPERLAQNLDVFGFELSGEDVASLYLLESQEAEIVDSDEFGH